MGFCLNARNPVMISHTLSDPRKLRIAVVSSIDWRTPPRHSGTREAVASSLAEGLVAKGARVTLFATSDSQTSGKLRAICPRPLREDDALDPLVWNVLHLADVFARAHEFDVIHCHTDFTALAYAELIDTPIVFTMHDLPTARQLPIYHRYANRVTYVALSDYGKVPGINYHATVAPGVSLEEYKFHPNKGEYLLFVGSIAPDRRIEDILQAAKETNLPLAIGGPVLNRDYFEATIEPLAAQGKIVYLGPISHERRNDIYGKAIAMIHLSGVSQAFRLSLVEAMACGTPVIAGRLGANREIVLHGNTGFLVSKHSELLEAIAQVRLLDRRKVRQRVLDQFSQLGMVTQYLRIYEGAIQRAQEHIRLEEEWLRNNRSRQ